MSLTPPLQKLIFALAVARELHFGRAARRLNISQPYLSRTILEYESELRFALFRRNRRVVEVTVAGRAFLKYARELVADLDNTYARAVEAGRLISRQSASSLVIGCSAFVPPRLRCQARSIQRLRFPALHLELRVASPSETFESIGSGVFQAGLTWAPLDRDDLAQIPLRFERLHAVFPRAQSDERLRRDSSHRSANASPDRSLLGADASRFASMAPRTVCEGRVQAEHRRGSAIVRRRFRSRPGWNRSRNPARRSVRRNAA